MQKTEKKIIPYSAELRLKYFIQSRHHNALHEGALNIGRSQKIINLYLKYLWKLDWITFEPPHCPFDYNVLCHGLKTNDAWTGCDDITIYLNWVSQAETESGTDSIAQWEYINYPLWANQDPY